jgi:hypothetical protein
MGSRQVEHGNSQSTDIARRSSVSKPDGASPVMKGQRSRSSSSVCDPTSPHKKFAIPQVTHGMKSDSERGSFDANLAGAIMSEATRSADDFARDLHAIIPPKVAEG